jgi:hypothetical protein
MIQLGHVDDFSLSSVSMMTEQGLYHLLTILSLVPTGGTMARLDAAASSLGSVSTAQPLLPITSLGACIEALQLLSQRSQQWLATKDSVTEILGKLVGLL